MRFNEFVEQLPTLINKTADVDGIQVSINTNGSNATVYATSNGRRLGYAEFDRDGNVLVPYDLAVDDKYRGQGIAAVMYDYVKSLGFTIRASADQTPDGKYFWSKNRGTERVWEDKTLDPELYGEMLPTATVKRIVNTVMSQVDPGAKTTVKQSPEGYYIVRSEGLRLDFGITADGGDINANIVNAYSSYKGAGVVTRIFSECFKAAEQLWGKPNRFVISAHEDRGHGVWQHIAQKLGAEWEGSINEISDDLRRSYLNRAGKHVDRRLERIAAVRDRLNKGYEIYHADRPTNGNAIVDHFEADTPALARQYYEKFIRDYVSDVDFDLRLRRATGIMEIARIPQGDFGTAGTIVPPGPEVERKELPGGSGLTYGINRENDLIEIMIFDGDKMAGELDIVYTRGATKTWSVDTVAVDPAHRGRGIAKALYGIALSILKLPLEAGQLQTKHGQQMWLMLNSIPGVEVMGYDQVPTQRYQAQPGDQIVFQDKRNTGFTFPVRPGKHSMRSGRKGTGIYTSPSTTMIAKWTGQ